MISNSKGLDILDSLKYYSKVTSLSIIRVIDVVKAFDNN
jgi:hypothetical protein